MYLTIKKVLISALLLTTINDFIRGFSVDILSPILNFIIPGDIRKPIKLGSVNLYLSRFIIRVLNLAIAILVVYYINKKDYYNY